MEQWLRSPGTLCPQQQEGRWQLEEQEQVQQWRPSLLLVTATRTMTKNEHRGNWHSLKGLHMSAQCIETETEREKKCPAALCVQMVATLLSFGTILISITLWTCDLAVRTILMQSLRSNSVRPKGPRFATQTEVAKVSLSFGCMHEYIQERLADQGRGAKKLL